MYTLIAGDEESLTDPHVEQALRERTGDLDPSSTRFFVAGDKSLGELTADLWGIGGDACIYLGPASSDMRPLWWWPWVYSTSLADLNGHW